MLITLSILILLVLIIIFEHKCDFCIKNNGLNLRLYINIALVLYLVFIVYLTLKTYSLIKEADSKKSPELIKEALKYDKLLKKFTLPIYILFIFVLIYIGYFNLKQPIPKCCLCSLNQS